MTDVKEDLERKAFEEWYYESIGDKRLPLDKYENGCYCNPEAENMFSAWLARAEQSGWIKNTKDSRPKYYGRNIVSTKLGNVFVADYDKHFCRWEIGGKIIDGVTHWQPLPQPPAGDHT